MPETVNHSIGIMDPNSYSFRLAIEKLLDFVDLKVSYDDGFAAYDLAADATVRTISVGTASLAPDPASR